MAIKPPKLPVDPEGWECNRASGGEVPCLDAPAGAAFRHLSQAADPAASVPFPAYGKSSLGQPTGRAGYAGYAMK
jgi:hypothetical protein